MTASVSKDGCEYTDEFGRTEYRLATPFREMARDEIEASRKRLLDRIAADEREVEERREASRIAAAAAHRAMDKSLAASRAVESLEARLNVLKYALKDSLTEGTR